MPPESCPELRIPELRIKDMIEMTRATGCYGRDAINVPPRTCSEDDLKREARDAAI
jgi:hypothetical protein